MSVSTKITSPCVAPIHPMAVSYKRIKLVHPIEFSYALSTTKSKKISIQTLYGNLWGKTVPVVMLEGFPLPRWWVKLWFHPFLLHPDENGILLVVDDWMACSRTSGFVANWHMQKILATIHAEVSLPASPVT